MQLQNKATIVASEIHLVGYRYQYKYLDIPGHTWTGQALLFAHWYSSYLLVLFTGIPALSPRFEIEPQKLYLAAVCFIAQLEGFALHLKAIFRYI